MRKNNFIYSLAVIIVLFTTSFLHSLENVHPHRLIMALEIEEQLDEVKERSEDLEKQLLKAYNTLVEVESEKLQIDAEKKAIEQQVTILINSLKCTTVQFETALDIIEDYEVKVKEQQKHLDSQKDIFFVLCIIAIIRMLLVVVGWILAWRKVKVPFWLDILL